MPLIACDRCETRFDTDRVPVTPHASTTRCPSCGQDHAPEESALGTEIVETGTTTRADSETLEAVATALGTVDGEVHIHYHDHTE